MEIDEDNFRICSIFVFLKSQFFLIWQPLLSSISLLSNLFMVCDIYESMHVKINEG